VRTDVLAGDVRAELLVAIGSVSRISATFERTPCEEAAIMDREHEGAEQACVAAVERHIEENLPAVRRHVIKSLRGAPLGDLPALHTLTAAFLH
jgi:hypothetical protein